MTHLYFCRHGESQLNSEGRWAGSTDTPLTDSGRQQARLAGQAAKDLHIDYIVSSPLSRAHETAQIIASGIGIHPDHIESNILLLERHFGSMEGQPWQTNFDMDSVRDAETMDDLLERARQTLAYVRSLPHKQVLVVSHGSFGRALRHVADPSIPFNASQFENASVVKLL